MDCERTAEMTMPVLMLLLPNSAKVMASSGLVAIRFILNVCIISFGFSGYLGGRVVVFSECSFPETGASN